MSNVENIHLVLAGLQHEKYDRDTGGIQLAEITLADALARKGNNISLYTGSGRDSEYKADTGLSINEISLGNSPKLGGIMDSWVFGLKVAALLVERTYGRKNQLIHFTSLGPAMIYLSEIANYMSKGASNNVVVYSLHNYHYAFADQPYDVFSQYPKEWQFLHDQETRVAQTADTVFISNSLLVPTMASRLGREIVYMQNTIGNLSEYNNEKIESPYNIGLVMCRLAKEKNLRKVIDAFSLAVQDHNQFRLLIAGDGEEEKNNLILKLEEKDLTYGCLESDAGVRNIITALKDSKVIFLGKIRNAEKNNVWRLSDLFILPSLREISPLVGLEAMVYGLPIVGSNIPGWEEYHNYGACVSLANPSDPDSIATEITTVLDKMKHKEMVEKFSIRQKTTYNDHYQPSTVVPKRLSIYEQEMSLKR